VQLTIGSLCASLFVGGVVPLAMFPPSLVLACVAALEALGLDQRWAI